MRGRALDLFTIQPLVVILGSKNRRHPIMDGFGNRRGICGDDRKTLKPMSFRRLPSIPKPRKAENRLITYCEAKCCLIGFPPFVVARDRHNAALLVERPFSEGALLQTLGSGVERAALGVDPCGPKAYESPSHRNDLALVGLAGLP